jgi:hypothetical protein
MIPPHRLPVREDLRPKPRRCQPDWHRCCELAKRLRVPAERLWDELIVHARFDGQEIITDLPLALAEALPTWGEA